MELSRDGSQEYQRLLVFSAGQLSVPHNLYELCLQLARPFAGRVGRHDDVGFAGAGQAFLQVLPLYEEIEGTPDMKGEGMDFRPEEDDATRSRRQVANRLGELMLLAAGFQAGQGSINVDPPAG